VALPNIEAGARKAGRKLSDIGISGGSFLAAGDTEEEIERAKAKLQEATFVAFDARQEYTFRKSEEDEAYYYLGKARNAALADPKDQGKQAEYAAREKVYRKLAKDTDDADRTSEEVHGRGIAPESTVSRRATLEDVFLHLTGRTLVD